jgi:hypothetical protein
VDNQQATVKSRVCDSVLLCCETEGNFAPFFLFPKSSNLMNCIPVEVPFIFSQFFGLVVSDCQFMNSQVFSDFEQVTTACTSLK